MSTKHIFIVWTWLFVHGTAGWCNSEGFSEQTTQIREKLSPIVTLTLAKHCGEPCASFVVTPRYTKELQKSEALGFSTIQSYTAKLKTIELKVLIDQAVPTENRNTLRRILSYRLANATDSPVKVTLQPLSHPSPMKISQDKKIEPKPASPLLSFVKSSMWPICVMFLGLLTLCGTLIVLRGNRNFWMRKSRMRNSAPAHEAKNEPPELTRQTIGLLERRALDLQTFIESKVRQNKNNDVKKLLSLFNAQQLTEKLSLSSQALRFLAKTQPSKASASEQTFHWLETQLDQCHWQRKECERLPLSSINYFSDTQLHNLLSHAPDPMHRAALLSVLEQKRWPTLISALKSPERIELGLAISRFQKLPPAEKLEFHHKTQSLVEMVAQEAIPTDGLLEDYTLYLGEKEGRELWNRIPVPAKGTLSLEKVLSQIDSTVLAELCLRLEPQDLKHIVGNLSASMREKLLVLLPKPLQERLMGSQIKATETDLLKARAALLGMYRRYAQEEI